MSQITVTIPSKQKYALRKLAAREHRALKDQIALFICEGLDRQARVDAIISELRVVVEGGDQNRKNTEVSHAN